MTGDHFLVCFVLPLPQEPDLIVGAENMASHRAQLLLHLLPIALAYGATETDPEIEPLKVCCSMRRRRLQFKFEINTCFH